MNKAQREIEVIFAGVGGKGVLVAGELLALAGMRDYNYALWVPTYAGSMRSTPCQSFVILSDMEIHSITIPQADVLVIMEPNQLVSFRNRVKSGGTAIIEEGSAELGRDDVSTFYVPSTRIAIETGDSRSANMVFLGALIGKTGIISAEAIETEIKGKYKGREKVLSTNLAALHKGLEVGAKVK